MSGIGGSKADPPQAPAKLAASSEAAASDADAESSCSSAACAPLPFGALPSRLARPGSLAARRPPGGNPDSLSGTSIGSENLPRPASALPRAPPQRQQRRPGTAGESPCSAPCSGLTPRCSAGPGLRARAANGMPPGAERLHAQPFAAGGLQRSRGGGGGGLAVRRAGGTGSLQVQPAPTAEGTRQGGTAGPQAAPGRAWQHSRTAAERGTAGAAGARWSGKACGERVLVRVSDEVFGAQ